MNAIGTTKFISVLSSRRQNSHRQLFILFADSYKISTSKMFSLADLFSIGIDNLIFKNRFHLLTNIVSSNKCYVLFFPTHKMKFNHPTFGTFAFAPNTQANTMAKAKEPNFPPAKKFYNIICYSKFGMNLPLQN